MSQPLADFPPNALTTAPSASSLSPQDEATAWSQRGNALQKAGNFDRAIQAYDRGLACFPAHINCLCNKAQALEQLGRRLEALASAQTALRLDPEHQEALLLCGTFELRLGNAEAAHACFLAVAEKGVVRNYPTAQKPARFRILMLFSPEAGNTPYEDLINGGCFDSEVIMVLRGYRNDPDVRSPRVDVVVNLVSETDFGLDVIASAIDLADSLGRPVVNHPRLILGTDRESISRRLAHVPDTVMPATIRIEATDLCRRVRDGAAPSLPVIVRHATTHGGEMMELVTTPEALFDFAEEAGQRSLYLTDYVDYRSADGVFRKYRFLFVGEDILPYHLAIGDGWKVHHASTRMSEVEWMRTEEQAFLADPSRVFGAHGMAALHTIRRQIGLDYCGIDCSIDAMGQVVVFEVNASMLIHADNPGFEYKTPYVKAIKAAFERLLEGKANEFRASAGRPAIV